MYFRFQGGDPTIRKLTYETVYEEIKRRIRSGMWPPGTQLPPLDRLSAELNVGISSVREAVRILGKQNILRIEQGRGTFVQPDFLYAPAEQQDRLDQLADASLLQLLEARLLIEPKLAALAAVRRSDEEARTLLANARSMAGKMRRGQDFLEEDLSFHELIAQAARHQVLSAMLHPVGDLLLDSRRRSMKWPGMDERASAYHTLIAHALAARDAEQAELHMRQHLEDMLRAFHSQDVQSDKPHP